MLRVQRIYMSIKDSSRFGLTASRRPGRVVKVPSVFQAVQPKAQSAVDSLNPNTELFRKSRQRADRKRNLRPALHATRAWHYAARQNADENVFLTVGTADQRNATIGRYLDAG